MIVMSSNEQGRTQGGRIANACAVLLPLLVAATKVLPEGGPLSDAADLLGHAATTTLAHVLATLSVARAILGAQRSAIVTEWLLRIVLGERLARRFRGGPSLADLIVSACQDLRAHKARIQQQ
jgi:hypothetical protein